MDKLKVVVTGVHYPLTMMRYFINALQRNPDIELWTSGPFTGTWIPWNDGIYLEQRYVYTPNFPLPQSSIPIQVPVSFVEMQLPWKPDVWLSIDAGWHVSGKPKDGKFVQIQTDPHVLKDWYRSVRNQYDYSFCMQTPYIDAGEIYLPYAYDPEIHYPMEIKKEYDVCLIGLHYEQRDRLIQALQARGISCFYGIGLVYDDYRIAYNKAKVAVSWSSLHDLPSRVWEYMGMRLPVVTNRVPDLNRFFIENGHYLGFSNVAEAVSSVQSLLENEFQAKLLAENGYDAVKQHTWDNRIKFIMEQINVW